jgi:hypothetical protein
MPDSKEYLHPEAIRRIHSMELRASKIVEGFLSGMHRSPYFGQSVEFVQHRQYAPGDDLRHIDWKVLVVRTDSTSNSMKRTLTFGAPCYSTLLRA